MATAIQHDTNLVIPSLDLVLAPNVPQEVTESQGHVLEALGVSVTYDPLPALAPAPETATHPEED